MEQLISYVQDQFIEKKDFPEFSSGGYPHCIL